MNHQFQFARSYPGARVIGRRAAPSSCSSAAFNHDQILTHGSGRGVPTEPGKLGSHASIPVRVTFVRERANWHRASLPRLGRPVRPVGPFGLRGCVNTHLANYHTLRDCRLKCVAKGSEHSKVSVPFAHDHEAKGVGSDQKILGVYQNDDC